MAGERRGTSRPASFWMLALGFLAGCLSTSLLFGYGTKVNDSSTPRSLKALAETTVDLQVTSSEISGMPFPTDAAERAAFDTLVADVKRNVDPEFLDKCLEIIKGGGCAYMAQGCQDWTLFHNFFKHKKWGNGFYVDLGSNDPFSDSNSVFFDKCLGWKGVCVEPNPEYHPRYANRTCQLFKNCVYSEEKELELTNEGQVGHLLVGSSDGRERGVVKVKCRTLESILDEAKVPAIDFVSLDVEAQEVPILQCFNFDKYDIKVWTVETAWQDKYFDFLMIRAGYEAVMKVLGVIDSWLGKELDTVYVKSKKKRVYCPHHKNPNYRFIDTEGQPFDVNAAKCNQPGHPLST